MLGRLLLLAVLFLPGSAFATDPYQWVGVTSVAFTGDGNGLGFVGMTTQCRADFGPGARMCRSEEVLDSDTLNPNAIPAQGCWLRPSWRPFSGLASANSDRAFDESGLAGIVGPATGLDQMTCLSWAVADGAYRGLTLYAAGNFGAQSCSVARPAACCRPTPVPSPTSSLSIPIGAAGLLGLSMLRG